jgi:hypothetical protein
MLRPGGETKPGWWSTSFRIDFRACQRLRQAVRSRWQLVVLDWPLNLWTSLAWFVWCALDNAVHRAPCDPEEFGDFRAGMLSSLVEGHEVFFLGLRELGLLAAEPALGLGDLHAFAGSGADEVGFEFGDHGQDVEEKLADGVGGVVDGPSKAELDVALGEVLDDVARVGQGTGEPVELGDHEGVAGPAGGEGLLESGAFAVPAGEAVVDVDQVVQDPECLEACLLRGEVLLVGGDTGVPDQVR